MSTISSANTLISREVQWVDNNAVTHYQDGPNCSQVKKPVKTCFTKQVFSCAHTIDPTLPLALASLTQMTHRAIDVFDTWLLVGSRHRTLRPTAVLGMMAATHFGQTESCKISSPNRLNRYPMQLGSLETHRTRTARQAKVQPLTTR